MVTSNELRSRTASYRHQAIYKKKKVAKTATSSSVKMDAAPAATKSVPVKGDKNGGSRTVPVTKAPRFYPAEDVMKPKVSRKNPKPAKLRKSLTPGTVVILLAGKFRGMRAVFLKQLPSGLLLVTGPYKTNGIPLKRVNQAYVVATSTKIDISSVKLSEKINDDLFKVQAKKSNKKSFLEADKPKKVKNDQLMLLQKDVDTQLRPLIKKEQLLTAYLKSKFTLQKGQAPHSMKF